MYHDPVTLWFSEHGIISFFLTSGPKIHGFVAFAEIRVRPQQLPCVWLDGVAQAERHMTMIDWACFLLSYQIHVFGAVWKLQSDAGGKHTYSDPNKNIFNFYLSKFCI